MKNAKDELLLLTVREVAGLLRVQRPKVYELIKEGAIMGFKVGADWRIRRDSVENLIGPLPESFFEKEVQGVSGAGVDQAVVVESMESMQ